jgi:hypothetical protein
MAASKKQISELENAIVILEERIEKLEEDHTMMKQMLSMQNALIENLQMMIKMSMSHNNNSGYQVVHLGGENKSQEHKMDKHDNNDNNENNENNENNKYNAKNKNSNAIKQRMLRLV